MNANKNEYTNIETLGGCSIKIMSIYQTCNSSQLVTFKQVPSNFSGAGQGQVWEKVFVCHEWNNDVIDQIILGISNRIFSTWSWFSISNFWSPTCHIHFI